VMFWLKIICCGRDSYSGDKVTTLLNYQFMH
jgi:hypothetical protein